MSRLPRLVALLELDAEPSVEFIESMRAQLFSELVHSGTEQGSSTVLGAGALDVDEHPVVSVTSAESKSRRVHVLLGAAAVLVLIAALAVVLLTRRPAIDTSHDAQIAERALVPVESFGDGWSISHDYDEYTTRVGADVAASVPSCAPFVDYVFDSQRRDARASQMRYQTPRSFTLWDFVSVFPSESAASLAMDKIAEPAFQDCFTTYLEAATPVISPGEASTSEVVDTPPLLEHGDRQIAITTMNTYQTPNGPVPITSINVFIQIDRAIVYVNPVPDFHADTDSHSSVEIAMSRATESLRAALGG
jgi:hypothetical protein